MLKVQNFRELTGLEYLKAEIACMHDKAYEKKSWDERLDHYAELNFSRKEFKEASNPIGMRAAVLALQKADNKEPTGYLISLDASSSGLQLLSLLVSCPMSWKLCGGDENVLDAYQHIYDGMETGINLERADLKQSIMTALYGSTATPKAVFGDDIDLFYETMEHVAPGAWDLNLGIQELWDEIDGDTYDWVMPDNFYACIETKDKEVIDFSFLDDKYSVIQKVQARPRFHKGLGPNLIHSIDGMVVREMLRRCYFNEKTNQRVMHCIINDCNGKDGQSSDMVRTLWEHYKNTGFLSARILDYIYEDTMGWIDDPLAIAQLISDMPDKPFEVITVHDCFRCHPNYGNDLRRQYNMIMADINDSNILEFIAQQVTQSDISAKKFGKIPREVILNGNYLLS